MFAVYRRESGTPHMGIDLCRRDVYMAQHGLQCSKIRAMLEQMCRKGVPQDMGRDRAPNPCDLCMPSQTLPEILPGHG